MPRKSRVTKKSRFQNRKRRLLLIENMEARIAMDASGFPGNDCPPDLDLSAIASQTITVGESASFNIFTAGATVEDLDNDGNPTNDEIRIYLDPDVPTDTPTGAEITIDGDFSWTPTSDQIGSHEIIVIAVDRGTPPLADSEVLVIEVVAPSEAPEVDLNGAAAGTGFEGSFVEDGGPVDALGSEVLLTSADASDLSSATIRLTNFPDGDAESLAVTVSSPLTADYDSTTGVLSITGTDTLANYQAALRSIAYDNASQDPDTANRIVEVSVNDGNLESSVVTATLTVQAVNDAPVADLNGTPEGIDSNASFVEDAADLALFDLTSLTDEDNDLLESATIVLTNVLDGDDEGFTTQTLSAPLSLDVDRNNPDEVTLTITGAGTLANYQDALLTITYFNNSQNPTETDRLVELTVNDGETASLTATATVTVQAVNDGPTVDLNGAAEGSDFGPVTFTEGDSPVAIVANDLTVSDPESDPATSVAISIENLEDGAAEELAVDTSGTSITVDDATDGRLILTNIGTADIEAVLRTLTYANTSTTPTAGDRVISVVVADANDGGVASTSTVTVESQNDAPQLAQITNRNASVGQLLEVNVTATDANGDNLTFQLDRDNNANIPASATINQVNNNLAVIRWTPEATDTGTFTFTVLVTDDDANDPRSDSESFDVTIVSGAPSVDLNGATEGSSFAATFDEDSASVPIVASDLDVADADSTSLSGATIRITNPLDGDDESLSVDETLTNNITALFDSAISSLLLTGSDTVEAYEEVLQTLAYENSSQNPTAVDRNVEVVVNDGTNNSEIVSSIISIQPSNDRPDLVLLPPIDQPIFLNQNEEFRVNLTVNDPDHELSELAFVIDDDSEFPTGNSPTITNGEFVWTPTDVGTFEIIINVTDGEGLPDRETLVFNVGLV